MHARSGWPLVFAAVVMCLFALLIVSSSDLTVSPAAQQNEDQRQGLVQFAASMNAADLQTPHHSESSAFQFPKTEVTFDPVVAAVSYLQPSPQEPARDSNWDIDLNPEDALGGLLPQKPTPDQFEPILEIEGQVETNPFRYKGSYQAEDLSSQRKATQAEPTPVAKETVSTAETGEAILDRRLDQDVEPAATKQEPALPSPYRLASAPKLIPHIKRHSEVVVRARPVAQPIAEIIIPEWDPKADWVKPAALIEELEQLKEIPETQKWADDTYQLIKLLHWTEDTADSECEVVFRQLTQQLTQLRQITVAVSSVPVADAQYAQGTFSTRLRTLHYDIARRLVVWIAAHEVAKQNHTQLTDADGKKQLQMQLAAKSRLVMPNVGGEWANYLLLEDLQSALNSLNPNEKKQRKAAQATLARLYSSVLSANQKEFLSQRIDNEFVNSLRAQATGDVEMAEVIRLLENHETNTSGYTSDRINAAYQSLLWSPDPAKRRLAGELEGHYRNANFRVSVSDRLINRLIPQSPEVQAPISENIMGAQVQGNSRIQNRLLIRLIPDKFKVNMSLEANGLVRSLTQARRSGFVIDNVGQSRFQVFKRIGFHRGGVETSAPQAVSDTQSQVVGMKSDLDPIPVLGWVARRIAESKIQESAPITDQLTREKIEQSAKQQMETEVQSQLSRVSDYLFTNMLQPLVALEVEPTPLEMRTTHERIIMRYRLAGRDQMASHTSRPRALASSLLSVQFHESVFNNLLDRIEISGRKFTAKELTEHLQSVFRSQQATGAGEVNHEASFQFAPYDPIRIEFHDDKVEISLNLKKFRIGKGKTWKELAVRATFNPQVQGTKLILVRDDQGIRLKGSNLKLRDNVAVRTVFTALFRDHYEVNVLPQKFIEQFGNSPLAISQLVLNDGWLGLSIGDAPRTAATFTDQR
jgi:hypothetical protein